MLQAEHSAILLTCIKLPFVIKIYEMSIFEWLFYTGFTVYKNIIYMTVLIFYRYSYGDEGVQWLSGRVLDSRPRGRGFEPHQHHCVVVLEQDTFILA